MLQSPANRTNPKCGGSGNYGSFSGTFSDPAVWAALIALIAMEFVLGIDNLIFISVLTNKLPEHQRSKARRIGIAGALILRLVFLAGAAIIVQLKQPLFAVLGHEFSIRDIILIVGGLFLVWKATTEIHHTIDPTSATVFDAAPKVQSFSAVLVQIILLDMVFSIDSILTAVGMTDHILIMVIAVVTAVAVMLLAADPLANFIHENPTVVILALGFLLLIGTMLMAEGFGAHVSKGYIYAAMAFSAFVEILNTLSRRRSAKIAAVKN